MQSQAANLQTFFELNKYLQGNIFIYCNSLISSIQTSAKNFHAEFAYLFHAEYAEYAEKEIPIFLRILREIKKVFCVR